jgi:ubiquinone/menaquinone biosynthesis C-methylase UbiE
MPQHEHCCPWWLGYFLANPVRRWLHNPPAILARYLTPGMTALEPGPGMGFFTLEMARLVGPTGRVIAVDIQEKMLAALRRRAEKAGLADRIEARLAPPESLAVADLQGQVDFVLGFWTVHELPDLARFFAEAAAALKPGGRLLAVEPRQHVTETEFADQMKAAETAGFRVESRPEIHWSYAATFVKQ